MNFFYLERYFDINIDRAFGFILILNEYVNGPWKYRYLRMFSVILV